MFGSIFHACHGAPILCCTTTDRGFFKCKTAIFWYCSWNYWSCIVRARSTRKSMAAQILRRFVVIDQRGFSISCIGIDKISCFPAIICRSVALWSSAMRARKSLTPHLSKGVVSFCATLSKTSYLPIGLGYVFRLRSRRFFYSGERAECPTAGFTNMVPAGARSPAGLFWQ